ncbi:acriflavine resistance protein E [Marinomonas ushuaiensis DSM 15871]|uniref:Acriflavine resistance protein E n=1 Tax=Marinomonas ushuaiensis DSM 15871 TaxID=1122207 RepID=X7E3R3_9GAMM|nr:efflux RND transporter periplasmic adaptor subunit [Marinomonas ushuaiensis]ETX10495.1 acriflavine resistance protein E [Marinomonas ushuaiensis DSM 15871]
MLTKFKYASGALLLVLLVGCQEEAKPTSTATKSAPKVEVGVVVIEPQRVELKTELPGRTAASLVAEIRPQVGGLVKQRLFEEGQEVKAGDVLYSLNDSTYVSSYKQAQADLESANAILASARQTDQRFAELRKQNNVSQSASDDAHVAYLEAVASQKKAEAALESAKINLEYTKITSPITGRIGISEVTVGALVTGSQTTAMTTVRSLDPIYVDLSQTSLDQLNQRTLLMGEDIEAGDNEVSLTLEDGSLYSYKGVLKAREVSVDESTGSVTLRAEFPNPDNLLLPGMFVRGLIHESTYSAGILVPQKGVSRDVKGNPIAYVVTADNTIEKRSLKTEKAIGNQWLISSGINAGDKIVVEGSSKVRPGSAVTAVELTFDTQTGSMLEQNEATTSSSN